MTPKRKDDIETTKLGEAVRRKRDGRPLRTVANELGEHFMNLARVESGAIPKPPLFIKLMVWLNVIDEKTAARLRKYADETRS